MSFRPRPLRCVRRSAPVAAVLFAVLGIVAPVTHAVAQGDTTTTLPPSTAPPTTAPPATPAPTTTTAPPPTAPPATPPPAPPPVPATFPPPEPTTSASSSTTTSSTSTTSTSSTSTSTTSSTTTTSTTVAPAVGVVDDGGGGLSAERRLRLIVLGLVGLAGLVAAFTVVYWRMTRPVSGRVLEAAE